MAVLCWGLPWLCCPELDRVEVGPVTSACLGHRDQTAARSRVASDRAGAFGSGTQRDRSRGSAAGGETLAAGVCSAKLCQSSSPGAGRGS